MILKRVILLFYMLLFLVCQLMANEADYNILLIQSYTPKTPWNNETLQGLKEGLAAEDVHANITTEYLDADYWSYSSEKEIMRRFCQRAKARGTDLIITNSDEAFHTLMSCGDSLPYQIPVVFMGIKYPDEALIATLNNVSGFTSKAEFLPLLDEAHLLFPDRHEIVCVMDSSFLASKGAIELKNTWKTFSEQYPYYRLRFLNTQGVSVHRIITSICYENNAHNSVVLIPKWSPFLTFIGKNSKAPFFSCQNISLTNGVLCAYDDQPLEVAYDVGIEAAKILKGASPSTFGVKDSKADFNYDYKQLDYFGVDKRSVNKGIIINEPYWEKYRILFILLNTILIILLVTVIIWLIRLNKKESIKRLHAQTRLLEQNYLVTQRDEFDNIFHSIRDAVVTYDTDGKIHFANKALLKMLHLPFDRSTRSYEGLAAGTLFHIYSNGKEILIDALERVINEGRSITLPPDSFVKEVRNDNYFPVSGDLVPIRTNGKTTGVALSFRNVSEEEMQKHFFNLAVEDSAIYPWQFNAHTNCFTFPIGFLNKFGFADDVRIISRSELENLILPSDFIKAQRELSLVLAGKIKNSRMSFRLASTDGNFEWWEFRTSVFSGLTIDSPYSILGVCQSIQRYKQTEEELIEARDKALETDKLKSAFLANMSHEIRTPLNSIVGFSDLLNDMSLYSEQEVKQFIDIINTNCNLLLSLINDILDLSRIESGSMDFVFANHNLPLILRSVYDSQQLNMPPGVKLLLIIPEREKIYIVTDNVRLQQVVNNLVNNAAKFTTHGSITIGYKLENEDEVAIFVSDTGMGISSESMKHIFDRFYKVDNFTQGAGLGLSICQTIVDRLNGTIEVESKLGVGTTFTIHLPIYCE